MTPERWHQIEEIFHEALELRDAERSDFINERAAGDTELVGEVEKLLSQFDEASSFIEQPLYESSKDRVLSALLEDDGDGDPMIGKRLGSYRIEREIGRGGMGAVYEAMRADGEFHLRVAVKIVKRGMDTDLILQRFRRERQILALLNHPNIAFFLGGGSTDNGLPYFVMEYIEGKPLYRYCDENQLAVEDRLKIFRQVCSAVDAAHQIKIVHRDLKPSNILVKDTGEPKLLDFGIAKVLDPLIMEMEIDPTATQMRLMTPEYASPEQMSGGEVGPSSDIYSLGVILYELLTGHRPYRLNRQNPLDVARVIREEVPSPPSECLSARDDLVPVSASDMSTIEYIFDARGASLAELRHALSGDLDRIVLKAISKDPVSRYPGVADFADDITNFLEKRPIAAGDFISSQLLKRTDRRQSIAIMPFKMIGVGDHKSTDDIFLGIGLADALVSRLSGVQRLIVRPTSSVFPFADENPISVGKKIDVDFVLEGAIRRIGDRIRVTAQLLSVAEGSTRWAEKFDENFTDVLELEDSISDRVAKVLLPHLTGDERRRLEKRGTNNNEAYQAYLRGRYFANQFTGDALLKAVEAFQEAISIDPNYALPHVGLADFYIWSAIFGAIPSAEAFPKGMRAALRALEIDDCLGEAFALLAFTTFIYDWNWERADALIKRSLELNPHHNFAHECRSNFLCAQGRFDEAVSEMKRAEELDAFSPRIKVMFGWTYYQTRQFNKSLKKARQGDDMQKDFPQGKMHVANVLIELGRAKEAIDYLRQCLELWPGAALPRYILCFALMADGRPEDARLVLNEMLAAEGGSPKPYFVAMAYVAVGEIDLSFEWFERSLEMRDEWMTWFGTEPKLDVIRKDPRYFRILEQTSNPIIGKQTRVVVGETTNGSAQRSIAVLPFRLITAGNTLDTDDKYLSVGMADALTMRLSNVQRFVVRPTSSVLQFADSDTDPFSAGRELKVDFVVAGNIRRVGERIRVTAHLLNVAETSTRWADGFDENFTDVLELEDSISEKVANCLIPRLTGEERKKLAKRGTDNAEAHEAYLQGRFFWNQFAPDSFPKSIRAFQKAIDLDPNYALAHVGIADYYTWVCILGLYKPSECFPQVLESATKALEIDPTLAEAYAAVGLYYSNMQQWDECEVNYRRSIELNPNYPLGHEWLSAILVGTGRFEEGTKEILLAEELDPLSLRPKVLSAWTIYQTRNYDFALSKARQIHDLAPEFMQSHMQMANILIEMGEKKEALTAARKAVELVPGSPLPIYYLCFALVAAGKVAAAKKLVARWEKMSEETYVPPFFLGMCRLAIGDIEKAIDYLDAAREERSAWILWFGTEPKLDPLREHPRFIELMEKTGLPKVFRLEGSG
jgi:serine/threonine protein kinase/tetratricopeptide (TPR) repeat protein